MTGSFRCILYVYKRTLLRASGREKDKKTRCGNVRRSNGKTGEKKSNTHRHWMPLGREGTTSDPSSNTTLTVVNGDIMQKLKLGRRVKDKSNTSSELLWHSWFLKEDQNNTTGYVENTTYDETIDIMNPYVAVYIWRRTA